jgi:hypothetical protein
VLFPLLSNPFANPHNVGDRLNHFLGQCGSSRPAASSCTHSREIFMRRAVAQWVVNHPIIYLLLSTCGLLLIAGLGIKYMIVNYGHVGFVIVMVVLFTFAFLWKRKYPTYSRD